MIRNFSKLAQMAPDEQTMELFSIALEDTLRPQLLLARSSIRWQRIKSAYMTKRRALLNAENAARQGAKDAEEEALKAELLALMNEAGTKAPDALFYGPAFNLD